MTLHTLACNAAVKLRNRFIAAEYGHASAETAAAYRDRLRRIERRFSIVYVHNRAAFFHEDDTVRVNGRAEHIDDVYTCERCDDACMQIATVQTRSPRGRLTQQHWCDDCYGDYACTCHACDQTFDGDTECGEHIDGEWHCQDCADTAEREESVPAYHGAKRWDLENSNLPAYSAELEVESTERGELVSRLVSLGLNKVSWERDGSLDCDNGIEILVQLRESTDALAGDLASMLARIKGRSLGLRSWEGGKCGFHLNSNRNRSTWNTHKTMRLLYIVHACKDLLIRISGRESSQWATFVPCGTLREMERGAGGKYRALRVGWDRFEWRMFRGTLSPKRIKMYCDTVKHLESLACSDIPAHHLKCSAQSVLLSLIATFNS